jgi:hypothetical protein
MAYLQISRDTVHEDRPKRIHGEEFILAPDYHSAARVVIHPDAVFPLRLDGYNSFVSFDDIQM